MRGRRMVRVAATAGMVSGARRNRAERKAIEQQTEQNEISQAPVQQSQDELTMQLEELNSLKNRGLITQEEFDTKKKQLLNL